MNNKLTEDHKEFIRKNYLSMSAHQMAENIGIASRHAVIRFKYMEGLRKINHSKHKVIEINGIFNVHALENWVA